jgi:hypothetical protein
VKAETFKMRTESVDCSSAKNRDQFDPFIHVVRPWGPDSRTGERSTMSIVALHAVGAAVLGACILWSAATTPR